MQAYCSRDRKLFGLLWRTKKKHWHLSRLLCVGLQYGTSLWITPWVVTIFYQFCRSLNIYSVVMFWHLFYCMQTLIILFGFDSKSPRCNFIMSPGSALSNQEKYFLLLPETVAEGRQFSCVIPSVRIAVYILLFCFITLHGVADPFHVG